MLITREESRFLGKVAFLGLWQGRFLESESIFNALRAANPENIGPVLGLGMLHIHKGDYGKAAEILEKEALRLNPEDAHAQAWLGLALFRAGRKAEAAARLKKVLEDGNGEDSKALAKSLLDEIGAK
ncbi:MAG: tetratricopeptide repeat protein [Desulfovibrio sp.]|jgi:Flp pilus assembly protein TadD|nr:tetratricopeptide repeat protein [Desulfovibrio sp.]